MTVRKHRGKWLVTTRQDGTPSYKTFERKKEASDYDATQRVAMQEGTYCQRPRHTHCRGSRQAVAGRVRD
jgi:hypothetical protein